MSRHALHAYDYVNQPYGAVRDALIDNPLDTLQRATHVASQRAEQIGAELHANLGGLTVGTEIAIELVRVESAVGPGGTTATHFVLAWRAAEHPGLFPTMSAVLAVYPLTPTETQLELWGHYVPPLGLAGEAVDALVMHHIAKESVAGFIQSIAKFLRQQLSPRPDARAVSQG